MKQKPTITDEEIAIFRAAMQGTKPLKKSEKIILSRQHKPIRIRKKQMPTSALTDNLADAQEPFPLEANAIMSFARNGLQPRQFKKLQRGGFLIEAQLDLHGQKTDQARQALIAFLHHATQNDFRCVRIIHGKGRGILKNHVNAWLQQIPEVLAFCSARPNDGDTGAVYVLLKN